MNNMKKAFRSGFVAVVGRPNVGKSTLINALLKQKIAAVSSKPQTTRLNQLGILTNEDAQIVFVDTPGIHEAKHALGEVMNAEAQEALVDSDLINFVRLRDIIGAGEGGSKVDSLGNTIYDGNGFGGGADWDAVGVINAVPIPGAVWLLGSALMAMVGLRRKLKH